MNVGEEKLYDVIHKIEFLTAEMTAWEKSIGRTIHALEYAESQSNKMVNELKETMSVLMGSIENGSKKDN